MTKSKIVCFFPAFAASLLLVVAAGSAAPRPDKHKVKVSGSKQWTGTNIDLEAGEKIRITATGTLEYPQQPAKGQAASPQTGPDGQQRGWWDLLRVYPVADGNRGALIGRIGDASVAQPFVIGASKELEAPVSGRLFLGVNQQTSDQPAGSYDATVEILSLPPKTANGQPAAALTTEAPVPGIDAALLGKIPRRIGDKAGNPGDMVNFLLLGSEEQVKQAFAAAGWVQVDKDVADAVVHGLLASLSKQAYLEMPMSTLYLFGRPQDYGFAHAEPISVVETRNHLRIWKAPEEVNGKTLWAGAATHDIGFEKDQRNNGVTHKIDPDVDKEREYVGGTLEDTGMVSQFTHVTPSDPLTEAKTATGGSFHSDGRILVMVLRAAPVASGAGTK